MSDMLTCMPSKTCTVRECPGLPVAKGLCGKHYQRNRKHGATEPHNNLGLGLAERLASRLVIGQADDCWVWTGAVSSGMGYGHIRESNGGPMLRVHRAAYELANGPVPEGLHVLHACDNPPCCNPAHLRLGTHQDNMRDRNTKGRNPQANKTHCPHGHLFDEENTYRYKGKRGCRSCRSDAVRKYQGRR